MVPLLRYALDILSKFLAFPGLNLSQFYRNQLSWLLSRICLQTSYIEYGIIRP
ncbi:hypothetical protein BABINDRAFT_71363 [Babjeviella inositovora NRRL Y-12698]|uniref:Uncharacterized protein n=1 Tax=Babjeviella inositovora NRRL Y-12698 TaxID=984486 RepID=A0A1E3QXJ1_9ASCO|nr:uncharacterized protein BABINDRAFT_71363 [Babjeviella inositovora NRRL Y-12698]ODQ82388.1 hypothetical protein BABINDRAFT_71363 [Babjeviella inositovora NRRL Y-12698]